MNITYRKDGTLPRLAWCAEVWKGGTVRVTHGEWVEAHPEFFTDGVWEGDFSAGDLTAAHMLMGFGGVFRDGKVVFCTPGHILERLHVIRVDSRLVLSPSMAFALLVSGRRLDISHISYQADLGQFIWGRVGNVGPLQLADGHSMTVVHNRNIEIDADLEIHVNAKPEGPEFQTFQQYREYLVTALKKVFANASDKRRTITYTPLATISSGYDSPACAALAFDAGCREAVTFRTSRAESEANAGPSDNGAPIARQLGLTVREYDRDEWLNNDGFPEAEFVVCGDLGQDMPWSAFSSIFERRLVITGDRGDTMWPRKPYPNLSMGGCSMVEFRSRVGFLRVPPAFFGSSNLTSIRTIANSPEMRPWQVGGTYDRPIARRIVEEKGVQREAFGQRKKAVAVLLNRDGRLDQFMKPESRADFERFYEKHRKLRPALRQALYSTLFLIRLWSGELLHALHLSGVVRLPVPQKYWMPPGRSSFLVHWAMPIVQKRYQGACEATGQAISVTAASPSRAS